MSLSRNAMLVSLSISQYSGKKRDKRLDESAAKACNTETAFLDAHKHIIDKSQFKAITKAANKIRTRHYELTIPWNHEGMSLLPSKVFWQYTQEMRELTDSFHTTVDNFLRHYELYKSDAKQRLGVLYEESDYPDVSTLKSSFGVRFSYFPIPSADHFAVNIEAEELEEIKASVRAEVELNEQHATQHLWDKVYELVERTYITLSDPEKIFKESLVDNLTQYVELIPSLNVLGDKKLDRVIEMIKADLCGYSADTLRHDKDVRSEVASKALKIRNYMEKQNDRNGRSSETDLRAAA
jgi:hypothetical protein